MKKRNFEVSDHLNNTVGVLQPRIKRGLPAYWEISKYNLNGTPTKRLMVVLRTVGCSYDKCTMCGFRNVSIPGVRNFHLEKQVNHVLETVKPIIEEVEYISLLGLGSFFDPKEIPSKARDYILKRVAQVDSIKKIQVESRIEYITSDKIEKVKKTIGNREFEVAIGIESSNEKIRNKILKKSLSWDDLKEKLALFRKTDTGLIAYILVKPPTLTDDEAVGDAVKSSQDIVSLAHELGINISIALEPTFVVSQTLLEREYLEGKYKPINLWKLIEVIKRIHNLCQVFVGLSIEGLINTNQIFGIEVCKVPTSCFRCRKLLLETIQEFNYTQNIAVFNELYCGFCKDGLED